MPGIFERISQALRRSKEDESPFRLMVEEVRDYAIFMLDPTGRVSSWNAGAARLQCYNLEEASGVPFSFFFSNEDIVAGKPDQLLDHARDFGSAEIEGWQYRKDGTKFWARVVVTALKNTEQKLWGFANVTQDLTKQKAVEAELRMAKDSAEAANRAKTAFLSNMSHEIRTPLGAVLGFADLLSNEELSPAERAHILSSIRRNGSQLSNLINDLLDLAKVEADRLDFEALEFDLIGLLQDVEFMTNAQIAAKESDVKFVLRYANPVPTLVKTDPTRLRQILLNLISNAMKFTKHGKIILTVECPENHLGPGAGMLNFWVRDEGIGMNEEQQSKIFEPFCQADSSTTRKFGGTGLGLTLSRRLAQLMGGDLNLIYSQVDHGSEFKVHFPVKLSVLSRFVEPSRKVEPGFTPIKPKDSAPELPSLKGLRVLLVEDSPDNQFLVKRFLSMAAAQVALASDGKEGVDLALKEDFDLILMDLQMPVMDGFEATAYLRAANYKKPIFAVTAHAFKEEKERCLKAGFDDHISKPIDRRDLIQKLAQLI